VRSDGHDRRIGFDVRHHVFLLRNVFNAVTVQNVWCMLVTRLVFYITRRDVRKQVEWNPEFETLPELLTREGIPRIQQHQIELDVVRALFRGDAVFE